MEARPTIKHERVCLVEIITPKEQIRKFFFEKHLDFLTSIPQQRLQEMILSSCVKGNSGKMSDYAEVGPVHRTSYCHFLSKGKWDDEKLEETQKRESLQTLLELSHRNGTPLFVSIRPLAKLDKAVVDASNQRKAKGKTVSVVAVAFREDTKPFDKAACSTKIRFFEISRLSLRSCLDNG